MELFFLVTQQNNVGPMFGEKWPDSHLLNTQLMLYCTKIRKLYIWRYQPMDTGTEILDRYTFVLRFL